ncbi:MAG TPA: Mut7-C RNAse domain-containing protein [Candidatus Limnocylindrales bacterium]|nr:Mut7-C RNAse domain-containing protein [Candidatus Limnocylindrales bacterium]
MVDSDRADPAGRSAATVAVRFHGALGDFLPVRRRETLLQRPIAGRPSVKDVLEAAGVPHPEIDRIVVNGRLVDPGHRLRPGDRVDAYPTGRARRAGTSAVPRFVLDGHLGRLAAHLRMCGFDTAYRRDADDAELAAVAAAEERVLLSRDIGLLKRSIVRRGAFVRADRPRDQLVEILGRFGLQDSVRPFSRCLRCNGRLEPVDRASVRALVPPRVFGEQDAFRRCAACGGVYWRGSHHRRMTRLLEDVLAEVAARALDGIGGEPEPLTNGSGGVALAGTPSSETMEESDVRRA